MQDWFLMTSTTGEPGWNMACDEWLLSQINTLGKPILRIYGWSRPSITIGYFQEYPESLSSSHCIIRRLTGGALVKHDSDLTFTVVIPKKHPWKKLPADERYFKIHERVKKVFINRGFAPELDQSHDHLPNPSGRNLAETQCFVKPTRYDVVVQGAKVAGGAQRNSSEGLLHQGSIQALPRITADELIDSWKCFGTNLEEFMLSETQIQSIAELGRSKYETADWNVLRKVK